MVLLLILYAILPGPHRYDYKIINASFSASLYGKDTFDLTDGGRLKPGWEPVMISGPNMLVRWRRW